MQIQLANSPVSSFSYKQRTFYVKRDDLLDPELNGNKARKLAYFVTQPLTHIDTIISHGGNQSNLMLALANLAKIRQWNFKYYTSKISGQAMQGKNGNLSLSLARGMKLIELTHNFHEICAGLESQLSGNELLISQGAAQPEAEYGIKQLAKEISSWAQSMGFKDLAIFLPSGTGTCAYYLQKNLPNFKAYTTNCVGTAEYLVHQMQTLESQKNTKKLPIILANTQFRFAQPKTQLWSVIQEIFSASDIVFDLVYDPVGWHMLLQNLANINLPILYIHGGGTSGNSSMLGRYKQIVTSAVKYENNPSH